MKEGEIMSLTREQELAIQVLLNRYNNNEKISILQGPAGSGKSYLLSHFMEYLSYSSEEVAFAAFTGTAAKILMNKGLNASTIHKLIYTPIMRRGVCIGFKKKAKEDLEHLKLIVVDEFSMVSDILLKDLLSFNIPLVLVGDSAQLPPIGNTNKLINTAHAILTEPVRQALDNPVLWAANQVRTGNTLSFGIHGGVVLVGAKKDLKEEWMRPEVRIIAGLNATRIKINEFVAKSNVPQSGHKIIFLKNDWPNMITNGTIADINYLQQISFNNFKLDFITEEGENYKKYPADFQRQLNPKNQFFDFAYAITCHRAQGATYDSPGLIIDESQYFREFKTNWLYTAITRYTGNYNVAILK